MQQLYYIDKANDTFSDALLAVGFAKLLQTIQGRIGKRGSITIQDADSCYVVELTIQVTTDDLQRLPKIALVRPVNTKPKATKEGEQEGGSEPISKSTFDNGFEYEQQKEISRTYYAARKEFRGVPDLQAKLEERGISKPDSDLLGYYQAIIQMKIASTFNDLTQRWDALGELQRDYISILFKLFQTPDNDIDAALAACQALTKKTQLKQATTSTALQIINPTTGKGANRAKANGLADGNLDSFWPLELLKFAGFMVIAAPYVIQGSKDRKTYVLQPKSIELSKLQRIMHDFRTACWSSTAVKLDVMASLRFAETFIEHRRITLRDEARAQQEEDEYFEEEVSNIAHGFDVALYKDMGSAYATMNISTINFPQWLNRIKTLDDAEMALELLKEHRIIIQSIRTSKGEEGAEEYELLRAYRNFLSGNDLVPLWTFTTAYSSYLISQREHEKNFKRWLRQFSTTGLEQIIKMTTRTQPKPLSLITSNPGFQRIAYAIRQSTVIAQRRRSQDKDRTYEVLYGLGLDLAREARYRDKFLNTLSDFLMKYNAETAREEEKLANKLGGPITLEQRKHYKLRGYVAPEDINEIIHLMDEFDGEYEMVARLLIAYGYAKSRSKYEPHTDSDNGNISPAEDEQSDDTDKPEEDN